MKRGVLEEGADCGQAKVAGADGVVAVALNMVQESADERSVEVVQRELRRRFLITLAIIKVTSGYKFQTAAYRTDFS